MRANSSPSPSFFYGNAALNSSGSGSDGGALSHQPGNERWWAVFLAAFVVWTLFGNVLVVLSVVKEKHLRSVTNYFIVSLAVADITVGVLVMPMAVYVEILNGRFLMPEGLCDGWVAVDVMACTASILNMAAISIDRFMAVTQPLKYQHSIKNSKVYIFTMIISSWILSIAIALPVAIGANYTEHRVKDECAFFNPLFIIFSSMGSFFIPTLVMIILYWQIFKVIRDRAAIAQEKSRERKKALKNALPDITAECAKYSETSDAKEELIRAGNIRADSAAESPRVPSGNCAEDLEENTNSEDVWVRQSGEKSEDSVFVDSKPAKALLSPVINEETKKASTAKTRTAKKDMSRKPSIDARRKDKKERKATITLVVVLGVFLICWIPFFIANNLTAVCLQLHVQAAYCNIPPELFSFFVWLGYCNSTLNPLIYALLNNEYRRAFLKLLHLSTRKK